MRSPEEILKCSRLIVHNHSKSGCVCEIVMTKWSGTFVCGYEEGGDDNGLEKQHEVHYGGT